jgi:hypothetical protein
MTRADAEKILGPSGVIVRPDPHQRPDEPEGFDTPRFRPSEEYAIRWSHPSSNGHWIRVYFDKDDRVKAVEGATASDPPTLAERFRKWVLREP